MNRSLLPLKKLYCHFFGHVSYYYTPKTFLEISLGLTPKHICFRCAKELS